MSDRVQVAVITVNYGSHHLLRHNLVPLTTAAVGLTAVVCDNFTTDAERETVASLCREHGWLFVPSERNDGFAAGCNAAATAAIDAGAEFLLLLNPDARIDADTLDALVATVQRDPDCLAVPLLFDAAGRTRAAARLLRMSDGTMAADWSTGPITAPAGFIPWLTGACLIVPVALWQRIGGLAEDYFMYWEDVEFSYRAQQLGGHLVVVPEGKCVHDQGGTQRAAHESDRESLKTTTFFYYWARNRLLFAGRNLQRGQQSEWLRSSAQSAWYVLKRARGRRRAILGSPDAVAALARGVRDGRRFVRPSAVGAPGGASAPTR